MKLCWHDWNVWKETDSGRYEKNILLLSVISFVLAWPLTYLSIWALVATLTIGLSSAVFFFIIFDEDSFPKSGYRDKSCLKCGKIVFGASDHEKRTVKYDKDSFEAREKYGAALKKRNEVVDAKLLLDKF